MRVTSTSAEELVAAADVLLRGGLVAFPTETVYGLGANALDPIAVARIFEAKARPHFDPLIVHLADAEDLELVAHRVPPLALALASHFWPGPLTLVLPKGPVVPSIVTSGLDTVAVRVPDHPVARRLIELSGVPLAAPSANPFGLLSPTRAEHVVAGLGVAVDLIVDGGPTREGVESTIVEVRGDEVAVLRHGAVPIEVLGGAGFRVLDNGTQVATNPAPMGPGQLAHHYAPRTPLRLEANGAAAIPAGEGRGYLAFDKPSTDADWAAVEVLSASGDLREAAAGLFQALHRLDELGLDEIVAALVPEHGVGRAINDRLRRAAATAK